MLFLFTGKHAVSVPAFHGPEGRSIKKPYSRGVRFWFLFVLVDENQGGEAFFLIKLQFNDGNLWIEVVVFL